MMAVPEQMVRTPSVVLEVMVAPEHLAEMVELEAVAARRPAGVAGTAAVAVIAPAVQREMVATVEMPATRPEG